MWQTVKIKKYWYEYIFRWITSKKKINLNYSNNNPIHKIEVNNNSRNTVNIYIKKKLSDGLIYSSATSGINSLLSNTQKNNILSNIEFIEEYIILIEI